MKLIKLVAGLSMGRLIILAILATVAYYFTYFDDGTFIDTQITAMSSQVDFESARRVGIQRTMKKEEEMRGNLLQLERNLEVVKSKIPNEFKDTQMSVVLNVASEASGVSIQDLSTLSVGPVVPRIIDPKTAKPEDLVDEVKFQIAIVGTYDAFLKFLDVLTKEYKVIKVRNFVIEKNSMDIEDNLIKFKGQVIGYKQAAALVNPAQGAQ